jgi:hypothetical protein
VLRSDCGIQRGLSDCQPDNLRMPSSARLTPSVKSTESPSKKFRSALGFNQLPKDDSASATPRASLRGSRSFARKSGDTARRSNHNSSRKRKLARSSITDFNFEREAVFVDDNVAPDPRAQAVDITKSNISVMLKNLDNAPSIRRPPVRMGAQDGPWSVSVAENPHDTRSYSLYIKSESTTTFFISVVSFFPARRDGRSFYNVVHYRVQTGTTCLSSFYALMADDWPCSSNPQPHSHSHRDGTR